MLNKTTTKKLYDTSQSIKRLAQKLPAEINSKMVREMAISGTTEVVRATPVDTAQAKNNWITTLNQPSDEVFDKEGYEFEDSGQVAIDTLVNVSDLFDSKTDKSIYVANNLPYIIRLNNGYSDQTESPGYIQRAIEEGLNAARKKYQKIFVDEYKKG